MRDEHPLPAVDHVVDGVRLSVVRHGSDEGLPLLLIHGMPTSSYLWRDVQRDLGHAHPTIAADLLGLGGSERPAAEVYGFAAQAQLLLRLLDELGIDRVGVVGHDVGGGIAVHLTAMAPSRVAALVLVDSPLHADTWPIPSVAAIIAPVLGDVQAAFLRTVPAVGRRYLSRQLGKGLLSSELTPKVRGHYVEPLLSPEGSRSVVRFARAFDAPATEEALLAVAKEPPPTLVLWGEGDVFIAPAYGRRLVDAIPGARWVPVPDAGHFLPEDRPERVAEEVAGFCAELAD